ncbi:MAG: hypothetical protein HY201_00865 [Nitrospirae bacterium]|nr:hypothetical protein [Candidatus Troglogloeales bacterium]MBI3598001.1 hypothetical protein [Candidatus Troglogloeales bacterium]
MSRKSIEDKNACQLGSRFLNWGHRGASGHAPENTLLAFQTAMAMGADGIECDIRESRDGKSIIFHDATLKRIAGRSTPIHQLSLAEIRKIDAGDGERIPTLTELLINTPPDFLLNLEIKKVRPEKLLNAIYRHNAQYRVLISAFDSAMLIRIRSLDSVISLGYLVDRKAECSVFKKANAMKAQALHFSRSLITENKIARVHREGFLVYAYTVDAPNQMSHFITIGMDGLFTNYPDRLSRAREKGNRKDI